MIGKEGGTQELLGCLEQLKSRKLLMRLRYQLMSSGSDVYNCI